MDNDKRQESSGGVYLATIALILYDYINVL
jgi:hypothetical protein